MRKLLIACSLSMIILGCVETTQGIIPYKPKPPDTFTPITLETLNVPIAPLINNLSILDPLLEAQIYAANLLGDRQYSCLYKLWWAESRWRITATNKSSGAYGIPQALPGSKMASEGDDWKTNPMTQVKWGLKYIKSRYDTACNAWSFFLNNRWY